MHTRRKRLLLLLLAASLALWSGCSGQRRDVNTNVATPAVSQGQPMPEAKDESVVHQKGDAVLWFRYLNEPILAPEYRGITQVSGQSYEMALLTELLSGPSTRRNDLSALFPEGTRVLSTVKQGRVLFVTFSSELLNSLQDEPVDWREYDNWRVEAPMRRRLAMQSLVATVTDNCDLDQVQVLVSQEGNSSNSMRLRQNYYLDDSEDSVLTEPLTRQESLLLTPATVLDTVLVCWKERDWLRLYSYLASRNPASGVARPEYRVFLQAMDASPVLVDFATSGGGVSPDGGMVVYTLDCLISRGTETAYYVSGKVLRLVREGSLWKITFEQLSALMDAQ